MASTVNLKSVTKSNYLTPPPTDESKKPTIEDLFSKFLENGHLKLPRVSDSTVENCFSKTIQDLYKISPTAYSLNLAPIVNPIPSNSPCPLSIEALLNPAPSNSISLPSIREALGLTKPRSITTIIQEPASPFTYIANSLIFGRNVLINTARGVLWAKQSLEEPLSLEDRGTSNLLIGLGYETGFFENKVWVQDAATAQDFYKRSFEMKNVFGGAKLAASCFKMGEIILSNLVLREVIPTLDQLAAGGSNYAQNLIGELYQGGQISMLPIDAMKCLKAAAEGGLAVAQYNLGIGYLCGHWGQLSILEAKKWLEKAAAQGHKEARVFLDSINK